MRFAGVLPEDAPDPRIELAERLALMPIAVLGLVPQPSLEDADAIGIASGSDRAGFTDMTASIGYTLWRNPADRSDPVNLADLDEPTRRALDEVPPWPRPAWLIEQVERMRYPMLWEAVWTTWHRDASTLSVETVLLDHVDHVLRNRYRAELGLGDPWDDSSPVVTDQQVTEGVTALVDGVAVTGVEVTTTPYVYGIGAEIAGGVVTAVIPRSELDGIRIEFATRP